MKSGFVAVVGRANAGKSTLVNVLVGEKVAIVSDRPQTTRNRIMGVMTRDDWQMVFLDTPGIFKPQNSLGDFMVKTANATMQDAELANEVMQNYKYLKETQQALNNQLKHYGFGECALNI